MSGKQAAGNYALSEDANMKPKLKRNENLLYIDYILPNGTGRRLHFWTGENGKVDVIWGNVT